MGYQCRSFEDVSSHVVSSLYALMIYDAAASGPLESGLDNVPSAVWQYGSPRRRIDRRPNTNRHYRASLSGHFFFHLSYDVATSLPHWPYHA